MEKENARYTMEIYSLRFSMNLFQDIVDKPIKIDFLDNLLIVTRVVLCTVGVSKIQVYVAVQSMQVYIHVF